MTSLTVRTSLQPRTPRSDSGVGMAGGWVPEVWLGAPAPGGLALPQATPTMAWMYSPRGVYMDQHHLVVADSGNHRVLIWQGLPTRDEQPADIVLGQADGTTEGRAAGGLGPANGMNLPTGVLIHDGRLIVADAWHHRILVWDSVPQKSSTPPDFVIGQSGDSAVEPNMGGGCTAGSLYWPFGIGVVGNTFWITDTGNRRVLGWRNGVPDPGTDADIVLGQPDTASREENRGQHVGPASFRWPHAVTGSDDLLLVADAGDHRVLGWSPPPETEKAADIVLGQPDFFTAGEWPYGPQCGNRFRFPYAVSMDQGRLAVADTANNRVLLWDSVPVEDQPAAHVMAQPTLESNGENRWNAVTHDSMCWPYGVWLHGDRFAVADSGNNRVVIWRRA
ncbi:MAG TPA: NHL repeat-containing protein [Mycobacterium sp.]|jgi:hypothetical protein|nr:NHL repeat-containing protein [Mycobacterium sp.]